MSSYKAISEPVIPPLQPTEPKMGCHCNLEYCSILFNCCTSLGVLTLIIFMFGSASWCNNSDDPWCEAFGADLGIVYSMLLLIGMLFVCL